MAMVPNRPGAMVRRVTTYAVIGDVVIGLLVGLIISGVIGFVLFVIGLVLTGLFYFNARQTMKTRGVR